MAEKKICNGKEDDVSKQQKNISDCANLCKKTSSMFVYGRHGQKRCWCMMDAADGQCTKGQKAAGSLDLYRIQPGGSTPPFVLMLTFTCLLIYHITFECRFLELGFAMAKALAGIVLLKELSH